VQEELLAPASSIGEKDIRDFLDDYAARTEVPLSQQQIEEILNRVLLDIDDHPERRLKSINELIHREISGL
jgi:hypothetical protein